ncbi:MAG: excinuclease ABC subunit UvrA [Candidatus Micrarchaeota archaeon]
MVLENIVIRGAREHNLKNIDLTIPKNTLTVFSGISGSGKSTLAFDTIYAEGQRRYVESLSSYARQFLGVMDKPDVDSIEGLSPAIAIDQKGGGHNPRSTVGTVTEIYDYLRLLYARIGTPHCVNCKTAIAASSISTMAANAGAKFSGQKIRVFAPVVRAKKGTYEALFAELYDKGYTNFRVNGKDFFMDESQRVPKLVRYEKQDIWVQADKFECTADNDARLSEALESATELAGGLAMVCDAACKKCELYNRTSSCPKCGSSFEELQPRLFSFNSPFGACPDCHGLGEKSEFDEGLVVPDPAKTIEDGAVAPWGGMFKSYRLQMVASLGKEMGFTISQPFNALSHEQRKALLYGTDQRVRFKYVSRDGSSAYSHEGAFEGVIPNLRRLLTETKSQYRREEIGRYMTSTQCPSCKGERLKKEALAVTVEGLSLAQLTALDAQSCREKIRGMALTPTQAQIARLIVKELDARLTFLCDVGLGYLTLSRTASSLSGGEAQRIRLATQIGSGLTGVLYVLDEPSIGLHQKDNGKLLATLARLRDLGNTLIVVEHDEDTMLAADFLVDLGPGAGEAGGKIVAAGPRDEFLKSKESITAAYLRGDKTVQMPATRRYAGEFLTLRNCRGNNLKGIDARFPLKCFTAVTGVSGSGKSTLVIDTLQRALFAAKYSSRDAPLAHDGMEGDKKLEHAVCVDQSPIGRTPRSNPATYIGAFAPIRDLFAAMPESRSRGFGPGRFSFNVPGGRCEACEGDGVKRIEMNFLPDVYVQCEQCKGKRYEPQTLSVRYKGKNVAEVLEMSATEGLAFFENVPSARRKLQAIVDVGLGYIKLGQPSTTLSGGEAQRIKLSAELSKRDTSKTIYILDEPTTGLHFDDVGKLLTVLQKLADRGNTIVVIEHNLDVIKAADWVIDLGPAGGGAGGKIIAAGTPEKIAQNPDSETGKYLKHSLAKAAQSAARKTGAKVLARNEARD